METSTAPYAHNAIPLSLRSSVGLRYRTLNCIECGHPFLERNRDQIFRIDSSDMPEQAHLSADGLVHGICGRCQQTYTVTLAVTVDVRMNDMPLYMQPQSLFITSEPVKHLRDIFCLECGKAFFSISDRIKLMVDNVTPTEMLDTLQMGPMEARCKFQHCKQRFYMRI